MIHLTKAKIQFSIESDSGYRASSNFSIGSPRENIIGAIEELARLAALDGYANEARAALDATVQRVIEWQAEQQRNEQQ